MPGFCAGVKGLGLAAAGGFAGGAGVFAGMPAGCWGRPEAFTLIIWGRRPRAGLGMGSSRDGTCSTPLQLWMNAAKQRGPHIKHSLGRLLAPVVASCKEPARMLPVV